VGKGVETVLEDQKAGTFNTEFNIEQGISNVPMGGRMKASIRDSRKGERAQTLMGIQSGGRGQDVFLLVLGGECVIASTGNRTLLRNLFAKLVKKGRLGVHKE